MVDDDKPKTPRTRDVSLREFLPPAWRAREGKAYVSAYRMLGVSLADVSPPFAVELGEACVVMGWFQLPSLGVESEFAPREDGKIQITLRTNDGVKRPGAPSALLFAPAEPGTGEVTIAQERIHEAVALLSAIWSMTLVFEHVEDYWSTFAEGDISPVSTLLVDPLWFQEATLDDATRGQWRAAADALAAASDEARVRLSLRWLDDAKRSRGIDSFIRFWFALETLAMPNTTDIRPIRQALAGVYDISAEEIEARFGIGRLFGLRSRIVHDGLRIEIPSSLLAFVAGVYVDVLVQHLGFAAPRRAQFALDEAGGLDKVLPKIVGGDAE